MVIHSCIYLHLHGDCESPCKPNLHGDLAAWVNYNVKVIYMVIHMLSVTYMVNHDAERIIYMGGP